VATLRAALQPEVCEKSSEGPAGRENESAVGVVNQGNKNTIQAEIHNENLVGQNEFSISQLRLVNASNCSVALGASVESLQQQLEEEGKVRGSGEGS